MTVQLLRDTYYRSLLGKSWRNRKCIGFYVFVWQNKLWNTRLWVIEKETFMPRVFLFTQCFGYDRCLLFYLNVELKIIVRHIHPRSLRFVYIYEYRGPLALKGMSLSSLKNRSHHIIIRKWFLVKNYQHLSNYTLNFCRSKQGKVSS